MSRDRYQEFVEERRKHHTGSEEDCVTITFSSDSNDEKELLEVLDKIGPSYVKLKVLSEDVQRLQNMVNALDTDTRHRRDDMVSKIKTDAKNLRSKLGEIKSKGEKCTGNIGRYVASSHHMALATLLNTLLHELSGVQVDAANRHAEFTKKELIITGQASIEEAELERLLTEPGEVFTQNIIKETQLAKQQLEDIQQRHTFVLSLEKSIVELHGLFQDTLLLVVAQGETISRIENNIFVSEAKTQEAKKQLASAVEYKKKAMKKKIIIGIIITVVLLIVALVIVFSFI